MSGARLKPPSAPNAPRKGVAGLLSIDEAAEVSQLGRRTITRGLTGQRGRLRHLRIGNRVGIHPDDLRDWLRSFAVRPGPPAIELPPDVSHFFPELQLVTPGSPESGSEHDAELKPLVMQPLSRG